jgi:hypothetical protein
LRSCWRNVFTLWLWVMRDLNDHEELRRDPLLGLLAGTRDLEEPLAGKSTLNRMALTPAGEARGERYHKIERKHRQAAGRDVFWRLMASRRNRSCSIWTPPTRRCMVSKRRVSFMLTTAYVFLNITTTLCIVGLC